MPKLVSTKAHILLAEVGWSQAEIARGYGCGQTLVSRLLIDSRTTSAPLTTYIVKGINERRAQRGMAPLAEAEFLSACGDLLEHPVVSDASH